MKRFDVGNVVVALLIALFLIVTFVNEAQAAFGLPSVFDTTWAFDKAVISLPNGWVVEGMVTSWKDYPDSDVVQVKIDGVTYLTHYSNVVLIDE